MRRRPEPASPPAGLLERVANFYRREFVDDTAGAEFLRGKGVTDAAAIERFGVGLSRGRLREAIPDDGRVVNDLRAAGLIGESGETLAGCVVVPLTDPMDRTRSLWTVNWRVADWLSGGSKEVRDAGDLLEG